MKNNNKILENRFINIDDKDISSVVSAMKAGMLAGTASIVQDYEQKLADFFKVKHALAVSSGTSALHLLMYLFDIKSGDSVVLPSTAPIMSVLPIVAMGADPIFVDTNDDNFAFDTKDLRSKITNKTKAILSVPMWGYPVDLLETKEIAKEYGVPLIEDASHCHGSYDQNGFVGTYGDVSFFSTQERKLIATGEGGFLLTDNDSIADRIRELRDFGKPVGDVPTYKDYKGIYGHLFGLNFRISALSAALGIPQTCKLDKKIKKRTENAKIIKERIKDLDWIEEIQFSAESVPNYYSMVFFVNHNNLKARDIAKVMFDQGIMSDTYRFDIRPLYHLPILKQYESKCPNSEAILQNIITVPTHEGMSEDDIVRVVNCLKSMNEK